MAEPPAAVALPDPVRQRLVALAADALPHLGAQALPPALRRVAGFEPGRRARVAAGPLAVAVDTDPAFRDRLAAHLRTVMPELVEAVAAGQDLPSADPVQVAALAYLLRPVGWEQQVATAADRSERVRVDRGAAQQGVELERARRQLAEARDGLRRAREQGHAQLASVKQEVAELRRTLAETRRQLAQVGSDAEQHRRLAQQAQTRQTGTAAAAEGESRRLRARVAALEAELAERRREVRTDRAVAGTRTRLLVETLEQAAQGLRRELALPAVDTLPGDAVDAPRPGAPDPARGAGRHLGRDDPALLEQLLALPRVHLVVDGYNVTKQSYPLVALEEQRVRLVRELGPLVARTGAEVTVVFDGADLRHVPPLAAPRGVRVLFSPAGKSADEVVAQIVEAEPTGRAVVVVSSDGEVAEHAARHGARPVASASLHVVLTGS